MSRPTPASRRKYLTRTTTTKPLESQETTTTPKPKFYRFDVSRRPPFLRRTLKPKVTASEPNALTKKDEKTPVSENDSIGKPVEIRDVVIALKDLQNAPLPAKNVIEEKLKDKIIETTIPARGVVERRPTRIASVEKPSILEDFVKFNASEITFTTSRPTNRFRLTESVPKITINKVVATTHSPKIYSTANGPVSQNPLRYSTTHTVAYTNPFVSETYPSDVINKIHPSSNPYSNKYSSYESTHLGYHIGHTSVLDQLPEHSKVLVHSNGLIECLDQGSFPHPIYCKKFISCAKMENGKMLGWEYTCPKNLSFDPIGGICNWSADLGCDEN